MRICPVGAELFRADGWTDKTDLIKLTMAFCKFATATNSGPPPVHHPTEFPHKSLTI